MKRFLAVFALMLLAAGAWLPYSLSQPYKGFSEPVTLEIPRGTTTKEIARQLADAGVIRWPWQFLAVRAMRSGAVLQAGEYLFVAEASPGAVFDRLVRGDVFFYEITVPEGSNIYDIARTAAKHPFLNEREVLNALTDAGPISDLAPEAETLEGYLFPSTYRVTRQTTPGQLAAMMVDQFRTNWSQLDTDAPVHETMTLASLVEKETGVARERKIVASVYLNRLRLGMRLECDPTTIYAALLERRYRGTIYRSDLASRNRYNTYQHAGLPPGPIANPGLASIEAALKPAETKFLFLVASPAGDGSHQFSETITQHQQAVTQYRRGTRKQQEGGAGELAPAEATGRH